MNIGRILGSVFEGTVAVRGGKLYPSIKGSAFVNAESDSHTRSSRSSVHGYSRMNAAYDVAIVGAGIVGAACAYECARRGLQVVIVDRDNTGSGTTAAGMGHIVAMDDSEAQFALTRYSQRLWQELRPELPDDVEYEQCGTVWVAADDEEMQEVERKRNYYSERGVTAHVLDEKQLRTLEPNCVQE